MLEPRFDLVAVVDANVDTVAVWHVDIGSGQSGLGRMCGAWVVANDDVRTVELVTRNRMVLATQSGKQALSRAEAQPLGYADFEAAVDQMLSERDRLQSIYERKQSKSLVPPRWPEIPAHLDLKSPPIVAAAEDDSRVALGIARWVERVALAWAEIERQRIARSYMIEAGDDKDVRPCPVVLVQK